MAIIKRYSTSEYHKDQERQTHYQELLRDERGRFTSRKSLSNPEELQLKLDRPIRLQKIKGTYGTYKIKKGWFTDERTTLYLIGISILFIVLFY